ncbi:MAG: hypothetical protein ABWW65_07685 [Thermoprotei archaeon]
MVREYSSFSELVKSIDESINALKQQLADFLRRLEDARARAEREKKIKELLKKLGSGEESTRSKIVDLKEVKLFINPDAEQESKLLEEVIDRINKHLQALQTIRKSLEPFIDLDIETKITVIYREEIPTSIIIRL